MHKIVDLAEKTIGNEICLTLYVIFRKRIHSLVLSSLNCDGESAVLFRKKNPVALRPRSE
jgi:hypothetical protein